MRLDISRNATRTLTAALIAVGSLVGPERFKAAVAFVYSQTCGLKSQMAVPTLVINGISDPEKAETCPRSSAQQSEGGAPAEERIAPNLFLARGRTIGQQPRETVSASDAPRARTILPAAVGGQYHAECHCNED
jgi:hypothetical protein